MAAAEAAWKALVRQRVVSAHDRVRDAREGLQDAREFILWQILPEIAALGPAARATAVKIRYYNATLSLSAATRAFNSALVCMVAAKLLALHGGNLSGPSSALLSYQLLAPQDAAERTALERLHNSPTRVVRACCYTELSCAHLSLAVTLLCGPGPAIPNAMASPDAIAMADREATTAEVALASAMQLTQTLWDEVTAAREILDP